MRETWEEYLNTRPPIVREIFEEYPPGTEIYGECDMIHYVIGVREEEDRPKEEYSLITSTVNPYEDYDGAHANKEYMHYGCIRRIDTGE